MSSKCPSCGCDNIPGDDYCAHCLHSLMTKDLPRPKKGEIVQKIMMTEPVSELITDDNLLVARPDDSIQKVCNIFKKYNKDCALVYKGKKLVGILSQRGILHRAAGKVEDFSKATIESVMSKTPECLRLTDPIAFAINKMSVGGFRHLPILNEDGSPITIISIRDVLCYLDRRD